MADIRVPGAPAPGLSLIRGLSGRLLLLTVLFVMLAEVFVFAPSVGRFRLTYLADRLEAAQIAGLVLEAAPGAAVSAALKEELLMSAEVVSVAIRRPGRPVLMLMAEGHPPHEATYSIGSAGFFSSIADALRALAGPPRVIMATGPAAFGEGSVEIVMSEAPMRAAMIDYGLRILGLSILISLFTAALVFLSLYLLLVKPLRRITENLTSFRDNPEDASRVIVPRHGPDEIAQAERELAGMQADVRAALKQKDRLAALGLAVAKINHDLRNILASAQLVSDRLAVSTDPGVQRIAPRLVAAIDRAIALCTNTLRYGRAEERVPERRRIRLSAPLRDIASVLALAEHPAIRWRVDGLDDFPVYADPEHLFRILINLVRNAMQALEDFGGPGEIAVTARRRPGHVEIDVADTGPGVPETARAHLFGAFVGSARAGGSGLGLAIARELARGHGGDVVLHRTGPEGTVFRVTLPD
ncbi:sensor histidine kinase [Futiania mangrovi]|uniref:histidine kinase n=1 Tax=Futiania mangrovi TaxID=2959716 RepID=A0A9J6PJ08_9PROT|nr:HAMP domain-containing sensor histidine kinase [Futiania mangrovii]MCP1337771.1 HAMP domain-containing histidine kinase [Futiania mangrovii]